MLIRQATIEDIQTLQLFEKRLRLYYKAIGETVPIKKRTLTKIKKCLPGYLIAEVAKKPVGMIYYKEAANCLIISHFWVNSRNRKRGVGSALFHKVLEIGRELGCTNAKLIVRDRNINAKNFYLKNGFVPGGTLMFLNLTNDKELND